MKKWFLLMCVFAFVGSLAVSAQSTGEGQYWAYNYTSSIKRLDLKIGSVKYSPDEYDLASPLMTEILESYTIASDTLKGILLVPQCIGCAGESEESLPFGDDEYASIIYVIRSADKEKVVWKTWADTYAGLFNAGVGIRPPDEDDDLAGYPTSKKKLTQAWMYFDYEMYDSGDMAFFSTAYGEQPYGFLGFGSAWAYLYHGGFGKAKTILTGGFCQPGGNCFVVTSISGSMVGETEQNPICGLPPVFDVCDLEPFEDGDAITNGTWSLKLNETMSSQINALTDDMDDVDSYVVGKLKGLALNDYSVSE